jgi:F0F1-type ATP synthase membrane subunit b/b'
MINSEIFKEIQVLEEEAEEIVESAKIEALKMKEEAKNRVLQYSEEISKKLNLLAYEKEKELKELSSNLKETYEHKYKEEQGALLKNRDELLNKLKEIFLKEFFTD